MRTSPQLLIDVIRGKAWHIHTRPRLVRQTLHVAFPVTNSHLHEEFSSATAELVCLALLRCPSVQPAQGQLLCCTVAFQSRDTTKYGTTTFIELCPFTGLIMGLSGVGRYRWPHICGLQQICARTHLVEPCMIFVSGKGAGGSHHCVLAIPVSRSPPRI